MAILIEIVGIAVDLDPAGGGHFPVSSIIVPINFRFLVAVAVVFIFNGNPGVGNSFSVFSYVILVYLHAACPHSVGIQVIPVVPVLLPGVGQAVPVGVIVDPAAVFLDPAGSCGVSGCGARSHCQGGSKYSHQCGSG